MAKLILQKENGEEVILRGNVEENLDASSIILRNECIAAKVWTDDDVKNILCEKGYCPSDENVAIVVNSGELATLADCTDEDWEIIYQAISDADGLTSLFGESVSFASPEDMLSELQEGTDLYNLETEQYVFGYNEEGAVATYNIDKAEALELKEKSEESGDYWGAFLGPGGSIWDPKENPNCVEECSNMDFCEENWNKKGWVDVTPRTV